MSDLSSSQSLGMKLLVIIGRHEGVKVLYPSYKERAAISAPRCSHNGLSRDMLSRLFGTSEKIRKRAAAAARRKGLHPSDEAPAFSVR